MTKELTAREEIAVLIEASGKGGITSGEIAEFFPGKRSTVSAQVSLLYADGGYRRERVEGTKSFRYFRDPDATPPTKTPKARKPTDAGAHYECEQLRIRVAELELWREEAVKRFPDLGVEPVVVTARQIVAKRLRSLGDNSGATAVLAGSRDQTPIMQAAVDALEWAA